MLNKPNPLNIAAVAFSTGPGIALYVNGGMYAE